MIEIKGSIERKWLLERMVQQTSGRENLQAGNPCHCRGLHGQKMIPGNRT